MSNSSTFARSAKIVLTAVIFPVFAVFAFLTVPENGSRAKAAGAVPDTPTGVTASDSKYNNKVGLRWDTIWGATSYTVLRNTIDDAGSATSVGNTAANFFFDTTAVAGQTYFYWVQAENGSGASPPSASDEGTRAVGTTFPGPFAPLDPPPVPAGNPITAAKAYLGKTLFWDEQLSSTRTVACGTCHRPAAGGSDPRSLPSDPSSVNPGPDDLFNTDDDVIGSPGVPVNFSDGTYGLSADFGLNPQVTGRKAPSYLNAGYSPNGLFWDGRALDEFRDPLTNAIILNQRGALESQSMIPPLSDSEMSHPGRDWVQAAAQIANSKPLALAENVPTALAAWIGGRTYPELFNEAFGTPDVTPARIAMAIATHERTLFSDQTPLDLAVAGIQPLTPTEQAGRQVFVANSCNLCHGEQLLSDSLFQNIGVRPATEDGGRFNVTGLEDDRGRFKTPSLRNVELRKSFMHNGRFATLESVVEFYDRGGDFDAPNIDHGTIRPLGLSTEEKANLVAFLERPLTDPRVAAEEPPFDRPTLYTESARVPLVSGTGRAGTGGLVPVVTAIEPPVAGNPSFTVAVSDALASSQAVLVIDSSDPGVANSIPSSGTFARIETTVDADGVASASLAVPSTAQVVGKTFYGRWYVTDGAAQDGFSVTKLFEFTVFGEVSVSPSIPFDFDGDGKTDVSVFRPNPPSLINNLAPEGSSSQWWIYRSGTQTSLGMTFGAPTDVLVPADYTGDGKTDVAFFRPSTSTWYILRSEDMSFYSFPFGSSGDIPAPGDFDGDGTADPAVFRPSTGTWYILRSSNQSVDIVSFGSDGDKPVVADYDGDGMDDIAIYRPSVSEWWQLRSSAGVIAYQFGSSGDRTVVGDYTGDGKADVAFFRPSTFEWYVLRSEDSSFFSFPWGTTGDIPAPGDYDGDGMTDATIFRPSEGNWYILGSTSGFRVQRFGLDGDVPVPSAVSVQ